MCSWAFGSFCISVVMTLECRAVVRWRTCWLTHSTGLPVLALCKATAVQVGKGQEAGGALAPNAWTGRVTRVARGEAGDEVAATLDAGVQMVGFAPPGSGLRARARVCLRADAAAIVLAL